MPLRLGWLPERVFAVLQDLVPSRPGPGGGDITVTKEGTVLRGLDIHGFVIVKAANVKIIDSVVRGGSPRARRPG